MRDVARTTGDDPEPEPAALAELAAAEYRERLALYARMADLLQAAPGPRTAAMWREAGMLLIDSGHHCDELRASLDTLAAVDALAERFYAAGWDDREAAYQREAARAPRQGHRATRRTALEVVRGSAPVAAILGVLHRLAGHGLAGKALAVHLAKVTAVGVASATAATGLTVVAAHVITSPSSPSGAWAGIPAPAASAFAAAPVSGPSMIGSVTRPKAATDASRWRQAGTGPGLAPPYAPPSSSSPSSAQPSQAPSSSQPQVQPPGGPAVLSDGGVTAIDLSSGNPVVITVSAGGSGWASWKIVPQTDPATGSPQADLDFSVDHGVLQAGGSVQVVVSVDPAQSADGNATETFTIAGVSVTASLPAPVAAPSPAATQQDSTPSDTPTPDPASS